MCASGACASGPKRDTVRHPYIRKIYHTDLKWLVAAVVLLNTSLLLLSIPIRLMLPIAGVVMEVGAVYEYITVYNIVLQSSLFFPSVIGLVVTTILPSHSDGVRSDDDD